MQYHVILIGPFLGYLDVGQNVYVGWKLSADDINVDFS